MQFYLNERELSDRLHSVIITTFDEKIRIQAILKEICNNAGWPYGEAWSYDDAGNVMKYFTSWYLNNSLQKFEKFSSMCKFSPGVGLIGKVFETRELVWKDNLSQDLEFIRNDTAKEAGLISAFALPVFKDNKLNGIFSFFISKSRYSDEPNMKTIAATLSNIFFDF